MSVTMTLQELFNGSTSYPASGTMLVKHCLNAYRPGAETIPDIETHPQRVEREIKNP